MRPVTAVYDMICISDLQQHFQCIRLGITGNIIVKPNKEDAIPYKTNRKDVKIVSRGKKKAEKQENEEIEEI